MRGDNSGPFGFIVCEAVFQDHRNNMEDLGFFNKGT